MTSRTRSDDGDEEGSRRFRSASPASCCLPTFAKPGLPLVKKVIAEFVGTFILIFSAAATPIVNQKYDGAATLLGAATSAGLAVCVVIISIGHISGAHLNLPSPSRLPRPAISRGRMSPDTYWPKCWALPPRPSPSRPSSTPSTPAG
ncbi:hypothetical protein OPV22_001138 [Ensete ventricosum]|uniref:Aquaporin n=1 Tax=Ensete ventricosum TaxID=4639 RepID=A0AAV8RVA1_ENSVE|nr:hypothetical protein OPV22_001138 [Ensete ventricosum]